MRGDDRIRGGNRRDVIWAVDGEPDVIRCGRGRDRAVVDADLDKVRGCERVKRRKPPVFRQRLSDLSD